MTTNLPISSELLTEKKLLNLLLSFGNTNDKKENISSFSTAIVTNLNLSAFYFIPSNTEEKSFIQSDSKRNSNFDYNALSLLLGKKKSIILVKKQNKKKYSKLSDSKDYLLFKVDKQGIIVLEGIDKEKVFGNKSLTLVLKKFSNTLITFYSLEEKSFAEYKYHTLINENNFGMAFMKNGNILEANKSLSRLTGYSPKELAQLTVEDLYDVSTIKQVNQIIKDAKKGVQKNCNYIGIIKHKSGALKNFECSSQSLYSLDEIYLGSIVTFVDITKSKTSQRKLSENELMLDKIIENSSQNILVFDKNKNVIHFNGGSKMAFKQNFNVELEVGSNVFQTKQFKNKYGPLLDKALKGEEVSFEYSSAPNNEGKVGHSIVTFKPFKDEHGEILGIISLTKDVTEILQRKKDIQKRESSLRAIIKASADGMYAVDRNMEIIFINDQAKKDFKNYLNIDIQTGDNFKDKVDKKTLEKWCDAYYNKVFNDERFVINATMLNKKDNKVYYVENRYSPVKDIAGNIFAALEISRNVTVLKNKERDLESKEAELRSVLEKTPTGIAKITLDGKINFITNKTSKILETKRSGIIGKQLLSFIHPSEHDRMLNDISLLLQGFQEINSTYRIIHPSKEVFYIHGVASVIKDSNDLPAEFLLAFNDITEKVIAQNLLSKSEKRYKSLLEGSPAGLAQVNEDGKFIFVSKRGAEILGDPIKKILTKNFLDYLEEHHRKTVKRNLSGLQEANELMDFRVKGLSGKGEIFYLDGTATLLTDEFEDESSVLFIFNDVTSRVLAEKELKLYNSKIHEKNTLYKALIDHSFDGIDIIELEKINEDRLADSFKGNIVIRNEKMNEYLGSKDNPIITSDEISKISPEYQADGKNTIETFENIIEEVFAKKFYTADWRINVNGSNQDYILGANLINLEDKTLLIRNLRKVTDTRIQQEIIKNQLNTLSNKNEELEKYIESNLQLENFAYIASHDLKAPLRTVSSFSFLLKQAAYNKLDDKSKGYLDIVLRSSTNMQLLIDDLLAFSRVGTQQVKKKEIDLGPMLKRILLDLNTNIEESNAIVNIHDMPKSIFADESMMIQIFQNLINNGLKFKKPETSPVIDICSEKTDTHWIFKIKDNGIGIKEENIKKIFGIFEKLHSNDVYEGTGLGLSICRKITEIHNGSISVESELGKGSEFRFSIEKLNNK